MITTASNYYRIEFHTTHTYTYAWGDSALEAIAKVKDQTSYTGGAIARKAVSCDWECVNPTIGGHYEQPKELPCELCKTLIKYDIYLEESGMCVECANEYYSDDGH